MFVHSQKKIRRKHTQTKLSVLHVDATHNTVTDGQDRFIIRCNPTKNKHCRDSQRQ